MAKQKFLKNLLTTASALTIITGSTTSALGNAAVIQTTANNGNVNRLTTAGDWNGGAAPVTARDTIDIANGGDTIAADINGFVIQAIRMSNAGTLQIDDDVTVGAVGVNAGGGNALTVNFNAGAKTVTFTGAADQVGGNPAADNILGVGDITFNAGGSTVNIAAASGAALTFTGAIINGGANNNILNVNTDFIATNAAAAAKTVLSIKTINIANNKTLTVQPNGAVAVTISGDVRFAGNAAKLVLDSANAGAAATFTINGGSIGGAGGGGVVELNAGGNDLTIAKNAAEALGVDNGGGRLTELQIIGANAANVNVNTFAQIITVGGGNAVTFGEAVDSGIGSTLSFTGVRDINFSNDATIATIDFNNQASTITIADNKTITGAVDSTGGANGTLNFAANGAVTGAIGATNALAAINFNGAGAVNLGSTVNAAAININHANAVVTAVGLITGDVEYKAAGTLGANGGVTGNVVFGDHDGAALNLGAALTGNVTSNLTGVHAATIAGVGGITGNVTIANTGILNIAGLITGNVAYTAAGTLSATGGVTGNVDFGANNASVLTINQAADTKVTGNFANAANATFNIITGNANSVTVNDTAGAIGIINIGNAANAGTDGNLTIDVSANNMALLNNGAAINFKTAASLLKLTSNAGANKTITFFAALDPGADDHGKVELNNTAGKQLIINSNAGKGVDSLGVVGQRLRELIISGGNDVVVNVNTYAKNIIINDDNTVVFFELVNSGANSSLVFNADATAQFDNANVAIATVDFNNNAGDIGFNAANTNFAGSFANAANATLTASKDLTITDASVGDIKTINIGAAGNAANLTLDANAGNINLMTAANSSINFDHANSTLILTNSNVGNRKTFTLNGTIGGDAANGGDLGKVTINSVNGGLTLANGGAGQLGIDNARRLDVLEITGDKATPINVPVFAAAIDINNKNTTTFGQFVDTGAGGTLTFTAAGTVVLAGGADIATVDFTVGGGTLTINNGGGLTTLTNTTFQNPANGTLNVNSNFTAETAAGVAPTADEIANVNVADNVTFIIKAVDRHLAPVAGAGWAFLGDNSAIVFDVDTTAVNNKNIQFQANFDPVGGADNKGKIEFINTVTDANGGAILTITAANANTKLGNANDHRLQQLTISGQGKVTFDGNINVFAKSIVMNSTKLVTFANPLDCGAGSNLTFNSNGTVFFEGDTIIETVDFAGNNGVLELGNAVQLQGAVDSTAVSAGILDLGISQVTGRIGKTNPLTEVQFQVAGAVNLAHANDAAKAATFKYFEAAQVLAAGGVIGDVDFNGWMNGIMIIPDDKGIDGDVDSTHGNAAAGVLAIGAGANSIVTGRIGKTNPLSKVAFTAVGAVNLAHDANTAQANVFGYGAAANVTAAGGLSGDIDFANQDGLMTIAADKPLEGKVVASIGDRIGTLTLAGNNTITGAIGAAANKIRLIDITGKGTAEFRSTIDAVKIRAVDGTTFKFTGNVTTDKLGGNGLILGTGSTIDVTTNNMTLAGDIAGKNTTISLNDKTLTYENGAANLTGTTTINTTAQPANIGNIKVAAGGNLTLDAVTVKIKSATIEDVKGKTYDLLTTTAGGKLATGAVTIEEASGHNGLTWSYSNGQVTAAFNMEGETGGIGEKQLGPDLTKVVENSSSGDIKQLIEDLQPTAAQSAQAVAEASQTAIESAIGNITSGISTRISSLVTIPSIGTIESSLPTPSFTPSVSSPQEVAPTPSSSEPIGGGGGGSTVPAKKNQRRSETYGIAAGDEAVAKHGIWGSPFYGQAKQRLKDLHPGYKAKTGGGIIGFDTMLNENLTLGGAFSMINTSINYKDKKLGDNVKADSYIWSLYGVRNLPYNFFMQGILSLSYSEIKGIRKIAKINQIASSKYSSSSYGGEITVGRNWMVTNSVAITPTFGLRYATFNDVGYKETGSAITNQTIEKKAVDKLEAIFGARLRGSAVINQVIISPEIHGAINQAISNKSPVVDARITGAVKSLPPRAVKAPRSFYNLGAGVTARYKMMEYGIGYDAVFAKKYKAQQGSLKIRVDF